MTTTKFFLQGADKAVHEAAEDLTLMLRQSLVSSGWSFEAAYSVTLFYTGERFDYKFDGDFGEDAQTLEFGTENQRPTGSIRKFLNQNQVLQNAYLDNLEKYLGELV
jgi:hypothetical protein